MTLAVRHYCACGTCWFDVVPGKGARLAAFCFMCATWVGPVPESAEVARAERR